jgi:putative membrane-bound dehydrogenase-like protein
MRQMALSLCGAAALSAVWLRTPQADEPEDAPAIRPNAVVDEPLPPEEAARTMRVPEGFQVTLFAGEPDVRQPIGMCTDDRGRLWIAEAYNYPNHGTSPGDRIIILEDTDGDGRADQRTVFYEGLNYVTGIEVGFGGAWVMSPPYFHFIPDRDGDDRADGPPEVLLDGFGNHANAHNLANGFAWGPDGWLYGTHGRTNWSKLGKPGTPDEERIVYDGGVYRYHPTRHVWEPYADGTTNPWGIDWNDHGDAFICNCVNPHLFHVIYGAHYEPWRNRESSRYAYQRIPTIADHLHFVGAGDVRGGFGTAEEDAAGGGHAHCGTMVYLGDNWPERYRNTLFTNNIHGRRINNDLLARHGSGYVASHGRDLMRSRDPWFMGVTLLYGPDGSVFVSDWSDTGECHSVRNTRRETGRIYKISYGQPEHRPVDLAKLSNEELVSLQSHRNDWFVRHARRLLQERSATEDMTAVAASLRTMFANETDIPRKLRALWALYVIGAAEDGLLTALLQHDDEHLRAWGARLLCEQGDPSRTVLDRFAALAAEDTSPYVRLHLASLLQRLTPDKRWPIARGLLMHAEDADDDNLPLMIWYGVEPLVTTDLQRFLTTAAEGRLPLVARFAARRAVSQADNAVWTDSKAAARPPCPAAGRKRFACCRTARSTRSASSRCNWR